MGKNVPDIAIRYTENFLIDQPNNKIGIRYTKAPFLVLGFVTFSDNTDSGSVGDNTDEFTQSISGLSTEILPSNMWEALLMEDGGFSVEKIISIQGAIESTSFNETGPTEYAWYSFEDGFLNFANVQRVAILVLTGNTIDNDQRSAFVSGAGSSSPATSINDASAVAGTESGTVSFTPNNSTFWRLFYSENGGSFQQFGANYDSSIISDGVASISVSPLTKFSDVVFRVDSFVTDDDQVSGNIVSTAQGNTTSSININGVPERPQNLSSSNSVVNQLTLNWDDQTGATSYDVRYRKSIKETVLTNLSIPSEYTLNEIGTNGVTPIVAHNNVSDRLSLVNTSSGISPTPSNSDSGFSFLSRPVSSNHRLEARINSFTNDNPSSSGIAFGGIMIRYTTAQNSGFVAISSEFGSGQSKVISRNDNGENSVIQSLPLALPKTGVYYALERQGNNVLIFYRELSESNWTYFGLVTMVNPPASMLYGYFATSGNNSDSVTVEFADREIFSAASADIETAQSSIVLGSSDGVLSQDILHLQVRSKNSIGNSIYSDLPRTRVNGVPLALSTPVEVSKDTDSIQVSIQGSIGFDLGYSELDCIIGTSTNPTVIRETISFTGLTVTYDFTGLLENTQYYIRFRAKNGFGNSAYSNEISVTTDQVVTGPQSITSARVFSSNPNRVVIDLANPYTTLPSGTEFLIEGSNNWGPEITGKVQQVCASGSNSSQIYINLTNPVKRSNCLLLDITIDGADFENIPVVNDISSGVVSCPCPEIPDEQTVVNNDSTGWSFNELVKYNFNSLGSEVLEGLCGSSVSNRVIGFNDAGNLEIHNDQTRNRRIIGTNIRVAGHTYNNGVNSIPPNFQGGENVVIENGSNADENKYVILENLCIGNPIGLDNAGYQSGTSNDGLRFGDNDSYLSYVIIKNCFIYGGLDENLDLFASYVIVQDCIFMPLVGQSGTSNKAFNGILSERDNGGSIYVFRRNLFLGSRERNPNIRVKNGWFYNNIIYNMELRAFTNFSPKTDLFPSSFDTNVNWTNNLVIFGNHSSGFSSLINLGSEGSATLNVYFEENKIYNLDGTIDDLNSSSSQYIQNTSENSSSVNISQSLLVASTHPDYNPLPIEILPEYFAAHCGPSARNRQTFLADLFNNDWGSYNAGTPWPVPSPATKYNYQRNYINSPWLSQVSQNDSTGLLVNMGDRVNGNFTEDSNPFSSNSDHPNYDNLTIQMMKIHHLVNGKRSNLNS